MDEVTQEEWEAAIRLGELEDRAKEDKLTKAEGRELARLKEFMNYSKQPRGFATSRRVIQATRNVIRRHMRVALARGMDAPDWAVHGGSLTVGGVLEEVKAKMRTLAKWEVKHLTNFRSMTEDEKRREVIKRLVNDRYLEKHIQAWLQKAGTPGRPRKRL